MRMYMKKFRKSILFNILAFCVIFAFSMLLKECIR